MLGYSPTDEDLCDWTKIVFDTERLYTHKTMRIRYTTYDVRSEVDVIHVDSSQCNVMLLNSMFKGEQTTPRNCPYLYGRAIGIFHANVSFIGLLPDGELLDYEHRRIDFVWVHWYDSLSCGEEFQLDRVALASLALEESVGFVDPLDIIRGVHLIPRFSAGLSNLLTPPTDLVRPTKPWKEYYVNRWVSHLAREPPF